MKKLLSLLAAITVAIGPITVWALNENADDGQSSPSESSTYSFDRQTVIDRLVTEFEGDTEKIGAFLGALAEKEQEYAMLDDIAYYRELYKIAREIKFAGMELAAPVRAARSSGIRNSEKTGSGPLRAGSSSELRVDNFKLLSGDFMNPTIVYTLKPNTFTRVRFDVVNDALSAQPIMAIVKLQHITTNAMLDVAIVEKTVAAESAETISAGFNLPNDAENYRIKVELWDDNMNLLVSEITLPESLSVVPETRTYMIYASSADWWNIGIFSEDGYFTVSHVTPGISNLNLGGMNGTHPSGTVFAFPYYSSIYDYLIYEITGVNVTFQEGPWWSYVVDLGPVY